MATKIVTKNSSTASAVPTASDLVQGELAVNVADKKLFTEDNSGAIIELADGVKLAGIEASADVTDTANVTAAGALMDSELTSIASVKALNQGVATTDSPAFAGIDVTGTATMDGLTVDGGITTLDSGSASPLVLERNGGTDTNTLINFNQATQDWYLGANTSSQFVLTRQLNADIDKALSIDPNGDISFYEDTGTTPKLFWDASAESLGIGTSNPSAKLTIAATRNENTIQLLQLESASNWANGDDLGAIEFSTADPSGAGSGVKGSLRYQTTGGTGSDTYMSFNVAGTGVGTNDSERMRIDSSGNVGIGNSSPSKKLHISTASDSDLGTVALGIGGPNLANARGAHITKDTSSPWDFTIQCSGSATANTATIFKSSDAVETMRIDASGNVGIGTSSPSSDISSSSTVLEIADSNVASLALNNTTQSTKFEIASLDVSGGALSIRDNNSERMRIDSSGNLMVGKTAAGIANEGAQFGGGQHYLTTDGDAPIKLNRLTSDGEIAQFRKNGTSVGSISVTASATAYNTSSDQRLKENIADADDAGSKIDAIQVRKYDWKADGSHQDYGMIAQELLEVAPEAVSVPEDSEEMMGVDYSKLVPMLIKEIQSLRNRVAQLEE